MGGGPPRYPVASVTGLENGVAYYIYIIAGNDIGRSGPSRIASGTPEAVVYERPAGCDQMAGLGQILAIVPDLDAVGPQVGGVRGRAAHGVGSRRHGRAGSGPPRPSQQR